MKLSTKINELIFELEAIELDAHKSLLVGDGALLRKNLLELYRLTGNPRSHKLIIEIMAEGGYPWFEKIARGATSAVTSSLISVEEVIANNPSAEFQLSDDEFMELLPANGHFH